MPHGPVGRVQAGAEDEPHPSCDGRELFPTVGKPYVMLRFQRRDRSQTLSTHEKTSAPKWAQISCGFSGRESQRGDARLWRSCEGIEPSRPVRYVYPLSVSHALCTALEKGRATEHKHPLYYTPKAAVCQLPIFLCRRVCRIRGGRLP